MSHICGEHLAETIEKFTTDTGIVYPVYMCKDCGKYYIYAHGWLIELAYQKMSRSWYRIGEAFSNTNVKFN